jgi:YD repeat-containing protein
MPAGRLEGPSLPPKSSVAHLEQADAFRGGLFPVEQKQPGSSPVTRASDARDYYATTCQYDWRDRETNVQSPADVVTHYYYDNLGRAVWTKTYASDDFTLAHDELRAESRDLYDSLGRVYQSDVYEVDQQDAEYPGTVGDRLPACYWYDAAGRLVKTATASGLFQKYAYDALGRLVASYTGYDADETAYADADDVTGDTVIEQTRTWYDQAGQAVATATYKRQPTNTGTGPLTADNADTSYVTASATWYDGIGRVVETANFGREDVGAGSETRSLFNADGSLHTASDGLPWITEQTPPATYSSNTSDSSGDAYIVAGTVYDPAGRAS